MYYSFDDSRRQTLAIDKTRRVLDECVSTLLERFERDDFFTQMHWLLKRLNSVRLDLTGRRLVNHFLEGIPPQKLVEWIKLKNIAVHELRFIFRTGSFILVEVEGEKKHLYPDFLRDSLNYEDFRRIFDNPRSSLYGISIAAKFSHKLLSGHFHEYSKEDSFAKKVSAERNVYLINESVELVEQNEGLSDQHRRYILHRIMSNTVSTADLLNYANRIMRTPERHRRQFDIDMEMDRFLSYRERYMNPPTQ